MKSMKVIEKTKGVAVVAGSSCQVDDFFGRLAANDVFIKEAEEAGVSAEAAKALLSESSRLVKIFHPVHVHKNDVDLIQSQTSSS
ncbi:MAG TPA: hypothetical protein VGE55_06540 [Limnobacter sp.]|uniref:hypothetical protein n=1 Tax=Limnobacter sp. TaxID=2003368 RepID=UPI002EDB79A6